MTSKQTTTVTLRQQHPITHLPLPACLPDCLPATACNCKLQTADTPEVTTALLKFMAEFVLNKTQRLTFDSSSPNGILLFREVSRVICTYGSRVLAAPPPGEPYGAVSCLPWLAACLGWLAGWRDGATVWATARRQAEVPFLL